MRFLALLPRLPTALIGGMLVLLACSDSDDGASRRPRQPSPAALAVQSTGGCYTGRGDFAPPADGKNDVLLEAATSDYAVRYTPSGACGGETRVDYRATLAGGIRLEATGPTSTARSGVKWRLTSPGSVRFVSKPASTSSSDDAEEFDTIDAVDETTQSRAVKLQFVLDGDLTYVCSFTLKWGESSGEFEECKESKGCESSDKSPPSRNSTSSGGNGQVFDYYD